METLELGNQQAKIEDGELVSYTVDGHEFIHQKGSPGWGSADAEMFPIIGPVAEACYMVKTPRGNAILDQHGHLRLMAYELVSTSDTYANYRKIYKAGTPIKNKKYPEKSEAEFMTWPYDFEFGKRYSLIPEGLEIDFEIKGDGGMPFMLGYHPAFKLHTKNPIIVANGREITLDEVLAVGSRALQVANCTSVTLKDAKEITISTEGFGHFMCWTEVRNMVCVEPVTFYPYAVPQEKMHEGFQEVSGPVQLKVTLSLKE